jgi:hypothetical protein
MAITPVPSMTDTPPFPALSDRAAGTYNGMAYAFGTHMADKFNGEVVAVAESAYQNAVEAAQRAADAGAAAQAAQSAALDAVQLVGVNPWVSGTTYAKNVAVISQVNFQTYRRRVAGAGTTDPANDAANWAMLTGSGAFIPQPAPATSINLAAGNYFTKTLDGNQTLTFDNCPTDGFSFTLELEVTSGILTLPTSIKTPVNTVYALTPGKSHLLFFVTKNRGARWRMTAAANFDI